MVRVSCSKLTHGHCDLIIQTGCFFGFSISVNETKSLSGIQHIPSAFTLQAPTGLPPQYLLTLFASLPLHCHYFIPSAIISHLSAEEPLDCSSRIHSILTSSNPFSITKLSFLFFKAKFIYSKRHRF